MPYTKEVLPNKSIFMVFQNRQNYIWKELEQWAEIYSEGEVGIFRSYVNVLSMASKV